MDDTDDFFFNATLSCYQGTRLYGYSEALIGQYEQSLSQTLAVNVSNADFAKDAFVRLNWQMQPRTIHETTVPMNFVYIQCTHSLFRICLIPWEEGVLILANSSPAVLQPCLNWFSTQFDCAIKPLHISQSILRHEYNGYLTRTLDGSGIVVDSQLVFSPPSTNGSDLRRIVIGVRGEDISKFHEANQEDVTIGIFEHLMNYTGIDFDRLQLTRVNCAGFVMTSNGKVKLFRRGFNLKEMWHFVSELLRIAKTTNHT
ncbi:hypothetical protein TRICI_002398 [Trichomonascus ciferrii]|uniref:Uncharacterized protein n=1 Tax=Trichomonascus ciferrii TaxID=44093 RepID=A0A642V721_9ASCO|nr:hypothetical protein TRICI_002398 [Trichomonascus ciferrii]